MKTHCLLLAAALVSLATAQALACARPPDAWAMDEVVPADGATDVPVDGAVVVLGTAAWDSAEVSLGSVTRVEVTRDGAPVAGAVAEGAVPGVAVWRAEEPLAPTATYVAQVRLENPDEWGAMDPEDIERTVTFTTGAGPAGPTVTGGEAVASARIVREVITECLDEFEGACFCQEERTVGHQERVSLDVRLPAPFGPWAGAYVGEVRISSRREGVAEGWPLRAPFGAGAAVSFAYDLGPRDAWSTGEVCLLPSVVDPLGGVVEGEVACVALAPLEAEPDGELRGDDGGPRGDAGTSADDEQAVDGGGCSAAGSAPAPAALALLVLVAVGRRTPRSRA